MEEMENIIEMATFGAGCFWHVEDVFMNLSGVTETEVGYTGGTTNNPTYEDVCGHITGHAEVVQIKYLPAVISFEDLLEKFFSMHNPTTKNRQGPDIGVQYRSAIFYHSLEQKEISLKTIAALDASRRFSFKIVTTVEDASTFYRAEEYHQKYYQKQGKKTCYT